MGKFETTISGATCLGFQKFFQICKACIVRILNLKEFLKSETRSSINGCFKTSKKSGQITPLIFHRTTFKMTRFYNLGSMTLKSSTSCWLKHCNFGPFLVFSQSSRHFINKTPKHTKLGVVIATLTLTP